MMPRSRAMSAVRSTGKPEGVVELENGLAVEHAILAMQRRLQHLHAVLERFGEALLLGPEDLRHPVLGFRQLGVGVAHHRRQIGDHPIKKRLLAAELVAVADRAPDYAAKHIAPALVPGDDPVDHQERAGADVVGDDFEGIVREILRPGFARGGADQVPEQVDLVVRVHALKHGGDAFEAHPRIDAGLGQRRHHALVVAVELHEDEVPDLDVAVAVGLARPRGAARDPGPVVIEDLAARAAGPGIRHLPEIVALVLRASRLVADPHAAILRHADLLRPEIVGLVVLVIDRGPQFFRRQLVDPGQQLPGEADGVALEVIAEREIAEHLEERVVARRVPDVLQVVVLAARAQAALRSRGAPVGPCLPAEEHVLELHHSGIGEEQRRVVRRHERAGGDDRVVALLEELQELRANLGRLHDHAATP